MNIHKVNFTLKTPVELNDDILEPIWDYLGCLYKNGQILNEYELIESEGALWAIVTLPDEEALKAENNNIYVNSYFNKSQEHFIISWEYIGENLNTNESCACKEPSWYMLYTDQKPCSLRRLRQNSSAIQIAVYF